MRKINECLCGGKLQLVLDKVINKNYEKCIACGKTYRKPRRHYDGLYNLYYLYNQYSNYDITDEQLEKMLIEDDPDNAEIAGKSREYKLQELLDIIQPHVPFVVEGR